MGELFDKWLFFIQCGATWNGPFAWRICHFARIAAFPYSQSWEVVEDIDVPPHARPSRTSDPPAVTLDLMFMELDNTKIRRDLKMDADGNFRMELTDRSDAVAGMGGSAHYHEVVVSAGDKDRVLVALLRDRFAGVGGFAGESAYEEWLKGIGVEPVVSCEIENA